ncbi:PLP-dependent aminotransferase family protein [Phreatobacter stygius]|uniref:aminotransferase-like domain-containing protein n=1 Tax=Phreatobacter stygius TaxID=1940610 RepID=UPI001C0743E4|nr:PLP-dependent aminotransferase family protein [Phreatobacter stygius]
MAGLVARRDVAIANPDIVIDEGLLANLAARHRARLALVGPNEDEVVWKHRVGCQHRTGHGPPLRGNVWSARKRRDDAADRTTSDAAGGPPFGCAGEAIAAAGEWSCRAQETGPVPTGKRSLSCRGCGPAREPSRRANRRREQLAAIVRSAVGRLWERLLGTPRWGPCLQVKLFRIAKDPFGEEMHALFRSIPLSAGSVTRQLASGIRDKIIAGHIPRHARMPSQRALAKLLGVSRGVIVEVYEQLIIDGLLVSQNGSGTFVNFDYKPKGETPPVRYSSRITSFRGAAREVALSDGTLLLPGNNHPDLFPLAQWRAAERLAESATRALRTHRTDSLWQIKSFVSSRLRTCSNVDAHPDNILVTKGTWPSLSLLGMALANPGERCMAEDPGHPLSCAALRFAGLVIVPVGNDAEGAAPFDIDPAGVRMILTSSAVQFPTGTRVTLARKLEIVEWARAHHIMIVEDDYEGCLGVYTENRNPYYSLTEAGGTIYIGSLSKFFSYRNQLGFLLAPKEIVDTLQNLQSFLGLSPENGALSVMAEFIGRGYMDDHIDNVRTTMAERKKLFFDAWRAANLAPGEHFSDDPGIHVAIPSAAAGDGRRQASQGAPNGLLGAKNIGDYSIRGQHTGKMAIGLSKITARNVHFVIDQLSRRYALT